eukprot:TRINITY_DN4466_c0_g1_i1.p1 TRINITY_DN4466_c0_g1~~TRINITY_DN4466_c0_g1_i1.p1  ORF type:complete len:1775 (+),score=639.94 TRINITY_DN4466_c0_g1_i1:70-5394(+)
MTANPDIELLDRVLQRIALADDAQLQTQISSLLVPVLCKLSINDEKVRGKVLEVLSHINKRIKPVPSIQLPMEGLVEQFLTNESTMVQNLTLIYIDMGFTRLSLEEKISYVPRLLQDIAKRSQSTQDTILHMVLLVVEKLPIPSLEEREIKYPFLQDPANITVILDFFMDVILSQPPNSKTPDDVPAGLSSKSYKRIMSKISSHDQLKERKAAILDLLARGVIFPENLTVPIFLVASCDTNHNVVRKGEDALKRFRIDYENKQTIAKLFSLFQGTQDRQGAPATALVDKVSPVNPSVRVKLVNFMTRSVEAANLFPQTLSIIFESVYGETSNTKLKSAAMAFVQWVFRHAGDAQLEAMGPVILSGLLKFLDQLKESQGPDANELKRFAYVAIGLLSKRLPRLFSEDLAIITTFFTSLAAEEQSVKGSIQDGLTMLCSAYVKSTPEAKEHIMDLVAKSIDKGDYQAKFVSLFYINRLFPFDNVKGRYLCLTLVDDSKLEVKEEAQRGLKPYIYKDNDIIPDSSQPYPDYTTLVKEIHLKTAEKKRTITKSSTGKQEIAYSPRVYEEILKFLKLTMKASADAQSKTLKDYLASLQEKDSDSLKLQIELINDAFDPSGGKAELHDTASDLVLQLLSLSPKFFSSFYTPMYEDISTFLYQGRNESRVLCAKILGILSPFVPVDTVVIPKLKQFLAEMLEIIGFDKQFGAINGVSYVIGRLVQEGQTLPTDIVQKALLELYNLLDNPNIQLATAAIQAVGNIGRYAALPIPDGDKLETKEKTKKLEAVEGLTKRVLVQRLVEQLSNSQAKIVETAAIALGHLSLGDRDAVFLPELLDGLYSTGINKNEEIHFTVGEALSCVGGGWNSDAAYDPVMDAHLSVEQRAAKSKGSMEAILNVIFTKHITNMRNRAAACVWLLSIVKNNSKDPSVLSQLPKIQSVFSFMLSDDDEVIQEIASRGLVFVYEIGDEKMKDELVSSLMDTLSTGKKQTLKVEGETQLFGEGTLGKAPDGSTLNTYKELCSLASEMGKPEMVYKFMNLASHHTLWNSRKGAAFATTHIIAQAQEQLKPFLPHLVPKLYRYSFDPNPRVSNSMKSILNALTDTKKITQDYFQPILKELLEGMFNPQWRVREGSCSALSDALQGKGFDDIKDVFEDLWYRCFRVLDDVKESVRTAALSLMKTLSGLTTRLCDPSQSSPEKGQHAIKIALPFLLQKGLVNPAEDIKKISLNQILKIAKVGGPLLNPHVPELVGVLLEGLTSLEPAAFSYMSFHTQSMGVSEEQLEQARVSVSSLTPMNETLDICIKHVDENNIEDLVTRLIDTIKTGVGLPTKVGAAKWISQLTITKSDVLKPLVGRLSNSLVLAVKDKSPTIRKAYANALGNVVRYGTDKTAKRIIDKLVEYYSQMENEDLRSASALSILELTRRAGEILKTVYKDVIPFIYVGRHDPVEEISKNFKEAWGECAVGSPRLYLREIIEFSSKSMESSSWILKKQAGFTLKDLAEAVGSDMSPHLDAVMKMLVDGLPGRIWNGKESLLVAIAALATSCKEQFFKENSTLSPKNLVDLVVAECKKKDREYKRHALTSLNTILKSFGEDETHDFYSPIASTLREVIEEEDIKEDADPKDKPLQLLARAAAFQIIGVAFPKKSQFQVEILPEVLGMLGTHAVKSVWNVRVEILQSLIRILKRVDPSHIDADRLTTILNVIYSALEDAKYSVIRNAGLDAITTLIDVTEGTPTLEPRNAEIIQHLNAAASLDSTFHTQVEKLKTQLVDHPAKKHKV